MNRVAFLLVLTVGIACQAMAATRVSVEQLEQLLGSVHGQSDGKIARQLSGLELTERASSLRVARWEALIELADASAFLDLPAAEMLAKAPPDREGRVALLLKTVNSLNMTVTKLPNFYAKRTTEHFEDTPAIERWGRPGRAGGVSAYVPLHGIGKSTVTVSYHDGYELVNAKKTSLGTGGPAVTGLTTSGEFGPILLVVFDNAIRGKMAWGHWEQGANGIEAVFRYWVAQGQSSYLVAIPQPRGKPAEKVFPAYHGELALDPATGDILRITAVGDFVEPYVMVKASIVVEYGSVPIGGANYICPVKGVALSRTPFISADDGLQGGARPMQTQLNDITFSEYHLFRGDARILPGEAWDADQPGAPK